MNNDEKLRAQMSSQSVPEELSPENIKKMLDREAPKKKRSGISVAGRITAAAAACAVIGSTAAYTVEKGKLNKNKTHSGIVTGEPGEINTQASYMSGASDYGEIYTLLEKADNAVKEKQKKAKNRKIFAIGGAKNDTASVIAEESAQENGAVYDDFETDGDYGYTSAAPGGMGGGDVSEPEMPVIATEETPTAAAGDLPADPDAEPMTEPESTTDPEAPEEELPDEKEKSDDYSDTYHQESGVLEADIVKTDGRYIYYLTDSYDEAYNQTPVLRTAEAENGQFVSGGTVDIAPDVDCIFEESGESYIYVSDMYLYNDMIAVIGTVGSYSYSYGSHNERTFAAFYTADDTPELIDVYAQDGSYIDVRISQDGYMYLLSSYYSAAFDALEDEKNLERYIPSCGLIDDFGYIAPADILLPEEGFGETSTLSYTVISSIDLNEPGVAVTADTKSLAGYSGSVYCSADNLYTASGFDETEITRISISEGNIVPAASGTIKGSVKDQFSMSEYGGYFRVAATYTERKETYHRYDSGSFVEGLWDRIRYGDTGYYSYETIKTDTRVYVLDMDLNIVGSVGDIGVGEQLKSASFSGNLAYVVTYRQTDPLYAIDLSDPANPVILDEFKINGYSTYMQQWADGLLLGFGRDADDNGIETGIKLTMFDNSDPQNLFAADTFAVHNFDDGNYEEYVSSPASWDRKGLLIAPGKNLIGFPVVRNRYYYYDYYGDNSKNITEYVFLSFEDGEFVLKGTVSREMDYSKYFCLFDRAIYIGDYIYTLSGDEFVAVDMETLEVTDRLTF